MRIKDHFFSSIVNLDQEEIKSQYQRSVLLIIVFTLIFCFAVINFFIQEKEMIVFYGGPSTFVALSLFVVVFQAYQLVILRYLKKRLELGIKTTVAFKNIHTLIEMSFPTLIVFYMLHELKMLSFVDSPITLTYFLFIILSILHLDFKVSIFSGFCSALQYGLLVYYGFNMIDIPGIYQSSTPENLHYVRCVLLILSGGTAAFVARELKNRILSTYHSQQAKSELELLLGQQVSKEVSQALMEKKSGTRSNEATVMFLDIRNFTSFADNHTAEEVIDYQNKILAPAIDIINQHQGVVFQILGDGIMACFGAPGENVLHADMAFQSGLEIIERIRQASEQKLIPPTTVGIGIHSGLIVTGNIGSELRKQFSISGTPVIIASRIEQLNKKYNTQFLISGEVFKRITPGKTTITFLAEEPLRGLGNPAEIYKVV